MTEFSFELHFGLGFGFEADWGKWENQHGRGIYFIISGGIFTYEFRTDGPLPVPRLWSSDS